MIKKFFERRQAKKVRSFIINKVPPRIVSLNPNSIILLPGGGERQTVKVAVGLYKMGVGSLFVPSGLGSEVDNVVKALTGAGVPSKNILVEERATRTRENARYSAKMLGGKNNLPCILIKQRFHLLRCEMNYRYWGFTDLTLYPSDAPGENMERADREGRSHVGDWIQNRLDRWFNNL